MEPEDAIGDGPFIYIALPVGPNVEFLGGQLPDVIPMNATRLLREWEMLLDPTAALRAPEMLGERDWVLSDAFVEPTSRTIHLIAEAARTDEVYERSPIAAASS